jgi:hypothetical protein
MNAQNPEWRFKDIETGAKDAGAGAQRTLVPEI